jgi:hypothetical protein
VTRRERSSLLDLMVAVNLENRTLGFIANLLNTSGSTVEREA